MVRRKDRELTDPQKIQEIIAKCDCCRLGLVDDGEAYIVPLNFAFVPAGDRGVFYFHSANEGHKIQLLRRQKTVSFELDCDHRLRVGDVACRYGYAYQSVMGRGTVTFVEDTAEKQWALARLMTRYTKQTDWQFTEPEVSAVQVIKLTVSHWTAKQCR